MLGQEPVLNALYTQLSISLERAGLMDQYAEILEKELPELGISHPDEMFAQLGHLEDKKKFISALSSLPHNHDLVADYPSVLGRMAYVADWKDQRKSNAQARQ